MTRDDEPLASAPAWSVAALSQLAAAPSTTTSTAPFDVPQGARYVLGPRLGQGGMGRVYSAWDRRLGRDVAFKEVLVATPLTEGLLLQEATLTAELDHPGIVPIYDAGRTADGRLYYTMRLVRGRSLRACVRELWLAPAASQPATRKPTQQASPQPTLAARLAVVRHVVGAAQAVAFAHGRQIVHRDLKPDNILVGPLGEVQVADWGLACRLASTATATAATTTTTTTTARPGGVVGTPGYQAPEVLRGEPGSVAVDVYALGAVLHEVLVGVVPASHTTAHTTAGATVRDIPDALWAIVQRAVQENPGDRYVDAAAFVTDLQAFFDDGVVQAHSESTVARLRRVLRRHRAAVVVGAVLTAVSATALAATAVQTVRERDRAVLAERRTASALATSLLAQAQQAHLAERASDARALADQVLQLVHDNAGGAFGVAHDDVPLIAAARGIVAAQTPRDGSPVLQHVGTADDLGCDDVFVPEHVGDVFACRTGTETSWRDVHAPTVPKWVLQEAAAAVAFDEGGTAALMRTTNDRLVLVSLVDGTTRAVGTAVSVETDLTLDVEHGVFLSNNRGTVVFDRLDRSEQSTPRIACVTPTSKVINSATLKDGAPRILCSDGTVQTIALDDMAPTTLVPAPNLSVADAQRLDRVTSARVVNDGFLLGTLRGEFLRYITASGTRAARVDVLAERPELGVLHQVLPLADDVDYLVGSSGAPMLYFHRAHSVSAEVGSADRGPAFIDTSRVLHTFGRRSARWQIAAQPRPRTVIVDEGLASVDVDDSGAVLASGANGLVVHIAPDGTTSAAAPGLTMTVKQAALLGQHVLTAGIDAHGPLLWPARHPGRDDGVALLPELRLRRIGALDDGSIWALGYDEGPWWFQALPPIDGPRMVIEPLLQHRSFVDGRANAAKTAVVALDNTGLITRSTPSHVDPLRRVVGAGDVAMGRTLLAVATDARVDIYDGDTLRHTLTLVDDHITDVVIDDHDRFVIAGTLHGEVVAWLLSSGTLAVQVQQHTEQVGAIDVVTRNDGAVVVLSAGWDHRVRSLVLPSSW